MKNESNKYKKTHESITSKGSPLTKYKNVIVGKNSFGYLLYFEFCQFFGTVPGALGIVLRKIFWPKLFLKCGRNVTFGKGITLRHPSRISIGKNVVISDHCILDARSSNYEKVIDLGDDGILSDYVRLACKGGKIVIGKRFGIGTYTIIHSGKGDPVEIGEDALIGPRCYISGGGNYNTERIDITIREQGNKVTGGTVLENDIWLGANVSILGGLIFETGSIAGAGAVVTKNIPARSVCLGVPAKVVKTRVNKSEMEIKEPLN